MRLETTKIDVRRSPSNLSGEIVTNWHFLKFTSYFQILDLLVSRGFAPILPQVLTSPLLKFHSLRCKVNDNDNGDADADADADGIFRWINIASSCSLLVTENPSR